MTLVDTSVWIDHLQAPNRRLVKLLEDGQVLVHPFVIGELACGTLKHRRELLENLERLPMAPQAAHAEAMSLVEIHDLSGRGIGWVDVHLLAASLLAGALLWTLDGSLRSANAHVLSRLPR